MTCPRCGSNEYRAISPGYVECTGYFRGSIPAFAPNGHHMGFHDAGVCGNRYRNGPATATPQCSCGTFSVGVCRDCTRPFCGNCSNVDGGTRRCLACAATRKNEHAKEQADAAERAKQVKEAAANDLRAALDRGKQPVHAALEACDRLQAPVTFDDLAAAWMTLNADKPTDCYLAEATEMRESFFRRAGIRLGDRQPAWKLGRLYYEQTRSGEGTAMDSEQCSREYWMGVDGHLYGSDHQFLTGHAWWAATDATTRRLDLGRGHGCRRDRSMMAIRDALGISIRVAQSGSYADVTVGGLHKR